MLSTCNSFYTDASAFAVHLLKALNLLPAFRAIGALRQPDITSDREYHYYSDSSLAVVFEMHKRGRLASVFSPVLEPKV